MIAATIDRRRMIIGSTDCRPIASMTRIRKRHCVVSLCSRRTNTEKITDTQSHVMELKRTVLIHEKTVRTKNRLANDLGLKE